MKQTLLFIFSLFLLSSETIYANNKLIDLNREWLNQTDINVYEISNVPTDEVGKIKMHLRLVEQTLRNRSITHLNDEQQINRAKCLDLNKYWKAGVFPQNEDYAYRTPIFIDKYNTFCAVGHVMKETGAENIARAISDKNNLIYLREIKSKDAINWIQNSGLSADECAWIQPGYSNFVGGEYNLDLSGLSISSPITNRAIAGTSPTATFSASISSTIGVTTPTVDASGNVLFQLGPGSSQCLNLSFQGAPSFLLNLKGARNVLGGTLNSNDSLNLSTSFFYETSWPFPFQGGPFSGPSNYIIPTSDISQDTSWYCKFFPHNYIPTNQFTICAARTSSSSALNNNLPVNLSVLIGAIVPIEYKDITVRKTNDAVVIDWSTISERNNIYFTIEKSLNGADWESIGQVNSKGNSSTETKYSFTDVKPVVGKNLYRIKNTSLDGNSTYSETKAIVWGTNNNLFEVISSNPVSNKVIISVNDVDLVDDAYMISNTIGQKMHFKQSDHGSQIEFDVSSFPAGFYLLHSDNINYKFLKK